MIQVNSRNPPKAPESGAWLLFHMALSSDWRRVTRGCRWLFYSRSYSSEACPLKLINTKDYENSPEAVIILAHGAGAPADSPFMGLLSAALESQGLTSLRFEFPYMQKRREDGKRRPPDRQPVLLDFFSGVVDRVRQDLGPDCRILVGGKSMGGRMASILASERDGIAGVVCYGYPFHPPGKPDRWRTEHFSRIGCPAMILQGTRDPFGKPQEVAGHQAELGATRIHWLEGGDHDFRPLVRQQRSQQDLVNEAAEKTREFIDNHVLRHSREA